jgi:hypothetical protein
VIAQEDKNDSEFISSIFGKLIELYLRNKGWPTDFSSHAFCVLFQDFFYLCTIMKLLLRPTMYRNYISCLLHNGKTLGPQSVTVPYAQIYFRVSRRAVCKTATQLSRMHCKRFLWTYVHAGCNTRGCRRRIGQFWQ